jgi:cell division transport system permease protein
MNRQTDIPFERDQSTRFLPWIVAVMVFLAGLAAAFAIVVGDAIDAWDDTLSGRLTIQVPAENPAAADRRVAELVRLLDGRPEIATVAVLSTADVINLLEPWLGAASATLGASGNLPLPRLIDVELATGVDYDATLLRAEIAGIDPAAIVDDHRDWMGSLIDLARLVEAVAFLVLALIGASAIAAVVFTTRSGLAVHAPIIELLHLMGARDRYVARQFQRHAMWLGMRGGAIGSVAAATVLAAVGWVARDIETALLSPVAPTTAHALMLAAVPLAAIVITMSTAHVTVMRALARLP